MYVFLYGLRGKEVVYWMSDAFYYGLPVMSGACVAFVPSVSISRLTSPLSQVFVLLCLCFPCLLVVVVVVRDAR